MGVKENLLPGSVVADDGKTVAADPGTDIKFPAAFPGAYALLTAVRQIEPGLVIAPAGIIDQLIAGSQLVA